MKKITIAYWISTGLFAFMMLGSAIPDALSMQLAVDGFTKMGFPTYMLPFLGIAKMLGVAAILIPGFPRIKEWAYAGLIIDLLGATYLIAMAGEPASSWVPMIIPLTLAVSSYILYHKKYKPVLA
jgi:uncharacterized membrane protein YphA (DoxX/SURF4 family)